MRNVYSDAISQQPNLSMQNAPRVSAQALPVTQTLSNEDIEGSQRVLHALFGENGMFPGLGVSNFSSPSVGNSAASPNLSAFGPLMEQWNKNDFRALTQGQTLNSFNVGLPIDSNGIGLTYGSGVTLPGASDSTNQLLATTYGLAKFLTDNPVS